MSNKICIVCREPKPNFTPEHVFPASIGGAFILTVVCKECNERLGKIVDTPFSRHPMVAYYRNIFKIRRDDRTIPNPFKGRHKDEDGNEYYIQFTEDGKPINQIVPQYHPLKEVDGRAEGVLTIPLKDYVSDEEAKEMYARKFKIDPSALTIEKKEYSQPKSVQVNISASNWPFMLGGLKIAYEFTATFIPEFIEDPRSEIFAGIILGEIAAENEVLLNETASVRKIMTEKIESIQGLEAYHHVVMLTTLANVGLVCGVRIFNWTYSIVMSERTDYLQTDCLFLVNNSLKKTCGIEISTLLTNFRITINPKQLKKKQIEILEYNRTRDFVQFKTPTGKLPVYNSLGRLLYRSMDDFAAQMVVLPQFYNHRAKEIIIPTKFRRDEYFLRTKKDHILFPILEIEFVYKLIY